MLPQSSQLCCLPRPFFPGLLAQQEPLGVWCHSQLALARQGLGWEELWALCALGVCSGPELAPCTAAISAG